ncbi:TM2 domain-containing protein [Nocardioides panacisoli]|uniref:TM2 domain-containing protein n=1 Tax=Nocardioides panacisoli TaxID=627624 RepID=A0ABP7IY69_9ACTN
MTTPPSGPYDGSQNPEGQQPPPPYGDQQPGYQPYNQQQQPGSYPPVPGTGAPGYGAPPPGFGPPGAPYGVHPVSGIPYSDKQKMVAGLLQIFLGGFGVGRFYIGDTQTGVLQIVVTVFTCGIGSIWGLIDGIMMLTGEPNDAQGRPLRPN